MPRPEKEVPTPEQIVRTITAARDSVWVINNTLEKLTNGATPNQGLRGDIDRNVGHLKIVTTSENVVNSGNDISDLLAAITVGEAKLAENIWPAEAEA